MTSSYYAYARPDVRRLVSARDARILDVGCGEGALAASLKDDGAAYVAGIELNRQAAAIARQRLDLVLQGDILGVPLPFAPGELDYVIFADVLEHLPDPDEALRRCLPLLKPDGRIVVSVPNSRFYLVLLRLLVDRWEYTDAGVRDRTHLRIFTRYSLKQFLARNGFTLDVLTRNPRLIEDQSQIGRIGALATRLSNATLARSPLRELLAYQYVAVATKRDEP